MKALCFLAVLQEILTCNFLTLTFCGLHDMDPSSVLCSCFSPVHKRLALLLGVQLKHSLCLHMCLKTQLKHREEVKIYIPHSSLIDVVSILHCSW